MGGVRSGALNIRNVAAAAGVSVATASRVLSKAPYKVAEETRLKVEEAARALGYVPNALARSLSKAKSNIIGVVAPTLVNPYYGSMIEAIDCAAKDRGLLIQVGLTNGKEEVRERVIDGLLSQQVDGLIICAGPDDHVVGRTPQTLSVPAVLIGTQANPGFPMIATYNIAAGWSAAEYLWSLGHRTFAYLTALESWHDFKDRATGLRKFFDAAKEGYELRIISGLMCEDDAYHATMTIEANDLPTVIVASTDRHALAAMAALSDRGVSIPDQVSVMGFDDYLSSRFLRPALTTMKMPSSEMGQRAAVIMADLLKGGTAQISSPIRASLVIRDSTDVICRR